MSGDPAWTRSSRYHWTHTSGGTVCATPGAFSAFAPPEAPELSYWKWYANHPDARVHYDATHPVPQRARLLGVRATLAEAKALVESHAP